MQVSATGIEGEPPAGACDWETQPVSAFARWLRRQRVVVHGAGRPFRETSYKTYAAIFGSWHQFLANRGTTVVQAAPADAFSFFHGHVPRLDAVSRRRYLQLLARVYDELRHLGLLTVNPINPELAQERVLDAKFPPGLSTEEQARLLAHLTTAYDWKAWRDRALVTLLWGAGLRCNEAISLTQQNISLAYAVKVSPAGVHRAHHSQILATGPWRGWLDGWYKVKAHLNIPGDLVCPATLSGKPFSPSGVYRRLDTLFVQAGVSSPKRGANVLRNTFAQNCLVSRQYTLAEIQEFLGHETMRSIEKHLSHLALTGSVGGDFGVEDRGSAPVSQNPEDALQ